MGFTVSDDPRINAVIRAECEWTAAHSSMDLLQVKKLLSDQYRQVQADGSVIKTQELLTSFDHNE